MDFNDFPSRWLNNLNLKLFAMNSINNLLPNIWCFYKPHFDPVILALADQHVTFTISHNNLITTFSVIYASSNYIVRRNIWNSLNLLQSQHSIPWCFIGDFNSIIGAHEHRGRLPPSRLPMEEFRNWSNTFNLLHIPTRGAKFTWANGRDGQSLRREDWTGLFVIKLALTYFLMYLLLLL